MNKCDLASMIDHTMLKPESIEEDIKNICKEAIANEFASVCINPCYVKLASNLLKESKVKVCTVIGFPLGATTTKVKAFEVEDAILNGAREVDMVINIGKLKDKDYDYVKEDIKAVVDKAKGRALSKVIIETCLLTEEEKIIACKIAKEVGADFVKTSTGFSKAGAKVEDIKTMRETVGKEMGVKASGGVRTYEDAIKMIEAGASRIGASASIEICKNCRK
ncbi:deoxyribose-phosphate aldolase [Clostridium rectalis]|uniref:deoxyribose-phosphate aldolase n=1 Tax=Clostridium rectalis TaxID=2040295 RepID=UPI000F645055|nr:deoxyribose-phosphate aldolase [Clostridium rectalis]